MTRSLEQALILGADVSALAASNLIVNGSHNVSQENGATAKAVNNAFAYATDQWQLQTTLSVNFSGQQIANPFPSQPAIPFGLKLAVGSTAAIGAGDYIQVTQPIEGLRVARLGYGSVNAAPVTVAFMARSSVTMIAYFSLRTSAGRSYVRRFDLQANSDTFVSFVVPGDVISAIANNNTGSLIPSFCFGIGANYSSPSPNNWLTGNFSGVIDATNLAASTANNVILSGVVVLPGIVSLSAAALALSTRHVDDELRLCQRYFSIVFGNTRGSAVPSGGYLETPIKFPVDMRVPPSLSLLTGATRSASITVTTANASTSGCRHNVQFTGTGTAGDVYALMDTFAANSRM